MRKIVLAMALVAVALLAIPGAVGAAGMPSYRDPDGRSPGREPGAARAMQAPAGYVPLGVMLGGAALSGRVRDFNDLNGVAATIEWWAQDATSAWVGGETTTDINGLYSFVSVQTTADTGELWVTPDPDTDAWYWGRYGMAWTEGSAYTVDFLPGAVSLSLNRGGPWEAWDSARVHVWSKPADDNGVNVGFSRVSDPYSEGDEGYAGSVHALPGTGFDAAVNFWADEGLEIPFSGTVSNGLVTSPGLVADESQAQRIYIRKPYWGSGKPGTRLSVDMWGFPAGWENDVLGYSDTPSGVWRQLKTWTAPGGEVFMPVTVPTSARPGYSYWIGADHTNGIAALFLETPFQVCTLNASRTAVRSGGAVKLSGVIPTQGHWGSQAGRTKRVIVWKSRTQSIVPQRPGGGNSLRGWIRVGSFKADGLGRYHTGYLHPTRTTNYIVWYPGDDWYWSAFTSVRKVAVR